MKKWTVEDKAKVAELLKAGNTAQQIGDHFGVTRNCITGLLERDAPLRAIGFTRKGHKGSNKGGRRSELTPEERLERKREYEREKKRRQRARVHAANGTQPRVSGKPTLRVVSNNVPLLIEDWLKQNGGPRRFERGFCTDYQSLKAFLEDRGVTIAQHQGKLMMITGRGRPRNVGWDEICSIADKFRVAEGLTPILRRAS